MHRRLSSSLLCGGLLNKNQHRSLLVGRRRITTAAVICRKSLPLWLRGGCLVAPPRYLSSFDNPPGGGGGSYGGGGGGRNNDNNSNRPQRRQGETFRLRRPQQQQPTPPRPDGIRYLKTGVRDRFRPHVVNIFPGADYGDNEYIENRDTEDMFDRDEEPEIDYEQEKRNAWIKKEYEEDQAKRKRWQEAAQPKVWLTKIDDRGRSYGRGGRKRAQARVWITPGFGEVVVNRQTLVQYFVREYNREHLLQPFVATQTCGQFDVTAIVKGGGLTGQAGAIRHGIARALNAYNPDLYRPVLKYLGYMTRDPRKVERKKVGRKKARKSPQWNRR